MKKYFLILGIIPLLLTACGRNCYDTTLYHLSGRQKPIVAVLPVIDNTAQSSFRWELSDELTDELRKRVFESKNIYLLRDGGNREIAQLLSTPNPAKIPTSATHSLGAAQFAVIAEIIEQDEESYGIKGADLNHPIKSGVGSVISLALRVRVIDVREATPKVILQEILDQDYVVSRAYMNCDYERMPWGSEAFSRTPMGIAHTRLIKTLVSRIEAYIESVR